MTTRQKRALVRILLGTALFALALFMPIPELYRPIAFMIPYAVLGYDILWRAARNIARGQIFDENFLMSIATVGAIGIREYPEAVAVMLFYQVGELFQDYAVHRSRRSIASLMDIRPDYANVERDGELVRLDPEQVAVGGTFVVKPGERVPLDGIVLTGSSSVDTSALTGESIPRDVGEGDELISGCINGRGLLHVRSTKLFGESTVSKILEMVENASEKKAKTENFITRFARYYTPIVVGLATLIAIVPPIALRGDWSEWIERALIFLVVSCPCALVISVPMSFFGGIGGASRRGVLVKGSNYLEALANTDTVVFDKTGTLTKGVFKVTAVHPETMSEDELLRIAALSESFSDHPISASLKAAHPLPSGGHEIDCIEEIAGHGVQARIDGRVIHTGNAKLMERAGANHSECSEPGTIVHVATDGVYAGHIVISDEIKPDAAHAIAKLRAEGVQSIVMLTGDKKSVADRVAEELGIDEVHSELMPGDKVAVVERMLSDRPGRANLAFVGDGLNDAPVLTRADLGIAMGGLGSHAAIEAADVVLMDDSPLKIVTAMHVARKTLRIVKQNIGFALVLKVVVLGLSVVGLASMWQAVIADVGVAVLAILNAGRAGNAQ